MAEKAESQLLESPRSSRPANDRNVMYVQRPVKTVVEEDPRRATSRFLLMICGVVALVLTVVVALGVIGLRLGFENTLGIPETTVSVLDSGILGIRMIGTIPSVVLESGNQVLLLPLLGLVTIAFPLAFIAMARPRIPGGPPPSSGVVFLSIVAAVVAGLIGLAAFIWLQIPFRTEPPSSFPLDSIRYSELWRPRVVLIGSIDVFAFLSSTLWLILLFRLPLVGLGWKYLRIAMIFFVLCTFVGMSTTLGLHQGLSGTRPVVTTSDGSVEGLLLGEIGDSVVVMSRGRQPLVRSIPGGTAWSFSGTRSVDDQFGSASR